MDSSELWSTNNMTWTPHVGKKRKSSDEQHFEEYEWTGPPAKQMVLDHNVSSLSENKDDYVSYNNEGNGEVTDMDEENTYYEYEADCPGEREELSGNNCIDDANNNNGEEHTNNNNTRRCHKRTHDQVTSVVLSEEIRETLSKRRNNGSTILPRSIVEQICQEDSKSQGQALVLWQPSSERLLLNTPEVNVDGEEDDTNIKSLEKKVTIYDPGNMEL